MFVKEWDHYESGKWVGTSALMEAARGKVADLISTIELREMLGVGVARISKLLVSNRILAKKLSKQCWAIPVDADGKPWVALGTTGPQAPWADKVNSVAFVYRGGPKGHTFDKVMSEVEAKLEDLS